MICRVILDPFLFLILQIKKVRKKVEVRVSELFLLSKYSIYVNKNKADQLSSKQFLYVGTVSEVWASAYLFIYRSFLLLSQYVRVFYYYVDFKYVLL